MEARVRKLKVMARSALDEEMKSLMLQDKSQGEKQKAIFESKLSTILSAIAALPTSSYDVSLKKRISVLRQSNELPDWLRSPMQRALKDGTSAFVKTRLIAGAAETLATGDAPPLLWNRCPLLLAPLRWRVWMMRALPSLLPLP
eukprot:7387161-Prymnesium_polylepis.1